MSSWAAWPETEGSLAKLPISETVCHLSSGILTQTFKSKLEPKSLFSHLAPRRVTQLSSTILPLLPIGTRLVVPYLFLLPPVPSNQNSVSLCVRVVVIVSGRLATPPESYHLALQTAPRNHDASMWIMALIPNHFLKEGFLTLLFFWGLLAW